jgi:hypothetical protein
MENTTTTENARCWQEFCSYPARFHIEKGFGLCGGHHNVSYFWAGRPVYNERECQHKSCVGGEK